MTRTLVGSETNDLTGLTSLRRLGRSEQRVRFRDHNTILQRHHSMPPKGRRYSAPLSSKNVGGCRIRDGGSGVELPRA